MRKKIVAGNWKMNKSWPEAQALVHALIEKKAMIPAGVQVIIAPPAPYLQPLSVAAAPAIAVAAQNCSQHDSGAYTGEISSVMLASMQVNFCLRNAITPIFCCGELLAERNAGEHFTTVAAQVKDALFHLSAEEVSKVVIAYEPVWAIGTGVTASNEQAEEMHAFIRAFVSKNYNQDVADSISILYGGSVNAANAAELFACPNVDGGLVGGASLKADDFMTIIQAAQ